MLLKLFILAQVKEENLQCVGQKSNFLDFADLDFDFLSNFFPRSRCSCAHLKGNFLNFPLLNLNRLNLILVTIYGKCSPDI